MRTCEVATRNMCPWDDDIATAVTDIVADMHPMDAREIFGLRRYPQDRFALVEELALIVNSGDILAGRIVYEMLADGDDLQRGRPVIVMMTWRAAPAMASFAFFGRQHCERAVYFTLKDLAVWKKRFGRDFGIRTAEVKVLSEYASARRWMERLGGEPVCDLGPIGGNGENYHQYIWRF